MDDGMEQAGDLAVVMKQGSRRKLAPFMARTESMRLQGADSHYRLIQHGDTEKILGTWDAEVVEGNREPWYDDVIELVMQETDAAGCKTRFSLQSYQVLSGKERVIQTYPMVAQPTTKSFMPTAEGTTQQALIHMNKAYTQLLGERGANIDAFKALISYHQEEQKQLRKTIELYQKREDEYRQREWQLMDRERELLRKEGESEVLAREAANERMERIAEKLGGVFESVGQRMGEKAVERMSPEQILKLITDNKDLVKLFMGQEN